MPPHGAAETGTSHDLRAAHESGAASRGVSVAPDREGFPGQGVIVGSAPTRDSDSASLVLSNLEEERSQLAGEIDPTGRRKDALDAFLEQQLQEGFEIETHTDTHAIIQRKSFLSRLRGRDAGDRYVVSVDEHGEVTMIPAEPRRS